MKISFTIAIIINSVSIIILGIGAIWTRGRVDDMKHALKEEHVRYHVPEVSVLYWRNRMALLETATYNLYPKHTKELKEICAGFQEQDSIFQWLLENDSTARIPYFETVFVYIKKEK